MTGAFIGVDIGTSGCKAVLLDAGGAVRASAWQAYEPLRGVDGEVSQDPDDWLSAAAASLRQVAARARELHLAIEAIAPTAPAHAAVMLDTDGRPIDRAILPYDTRSAGVAKAMVQACGSAVFERTFVRLGPSWTAPQLAWVRASRPEVWSRLRSVLVTKDFLTFALTGCQLTDPSDAAGTALYDQRAGRWDEGLCAEVGLRLDQLPAIKSPTDVAGKLTQEWASRISVPAGTPVVVGATDTACELVSLNIVSAGRGLVKIATTGTVVAVLDDPRPDPRVLTYPYLGGRWYSVAATNTAASAYRWLQEAVCCSEDASSVAAYSEMDRMASTVPAGSSGVVFLPFLQGERSPYWDSELRAAFLGLSAGHRRSHLCRATLEGVAFSLRDCRDLLLSLGIAVERPGFTGGGVASQLWRRILASVLDTSGTLTTPQGPSLGAAMLAAAGVAATMPTVQRETTVVDPEPSWVAVYDRIYPTYHESARQLSGISRALIQATTDAAGERDG